MNGMSHSFASYFRFELLKRLSVRAGASDAERAFLLDALGGLAGEW